MSIEVKSIIAIQVGKLVSYEVLVPDYAFTAFFYGPVGEDVFVDKVAKLDWQAHKAGASRIF